MSAGLVSSFIDDGESFVVVHQWNVVDNSDNDGRLQQVVPVVDYLLLVTFVVFFVHGEHEFHIPIFPPYHSVSCHRRDLAGKEGCEVVDGDGLSAYGQQTFALSSQNSLNVTVLNLYKILRVITNKRMGEVPQVGADHSANAVVDGLIGIVQYFDDAVVSTDVVSVMGGCLIGIGCSLATVGVDDVATEGLFNLFTIGVGNGGSGGEDVLWTEVESFVAVAVLCQ